MSGRKRKRKPRWWLLLTLLLPIAFALLDKKYRLEVVDEDGERIDHALVDGEYDHRARFFREVVVAARGFRSKTVRVWGKGTVTLERGIPVRLSVRTPPPGDLAFVGEMEQVAGPFLDAAPQAAVAVAGPDPFWTRAQYVAPTLVLRGDHDVLVHAPGTYRVRVDVGRVEATEARHAVSVQEPDWGDWQQFEVEDAPEPQTVELRIDPAWLRQRIDESR